MVKNKIIKLLTSATLTMMMIVTLAATTVNAADTVTTQLSRTRWVKNGETYVEKRAYALNNSNSHPIYQIVSVDGNTKKGTNYYCLNATAGYTWTHNMIGTNVTYDAPYDLVRDKSTIADLDAEVYKNVVRNNYNKILWILDNMYAPGGISIETLLARAGIVYGKDDVTDEYYYTYDYEVNPSSVFSNTNSDLYRYLKGNPYKGDPGYRYWDTSKNPHDVILTNYPEIVEAVQQAAIWHFTNSGNEYNCYTGANGYILYDEHGDEVEGEDAYGDIGIVHTPRYWLRYAENPAATSINWKLLANETTEGYEGTWDTGAMLQEQACILYNYLVDEANAHSDYTSETTGTLELTKGSSEITVNESGNNYIVGPLKITTTGTVTNLDVTPGTVTDASGTEKTLVEGEDFYVKVAKSSVTENITVKATGKTTATEKTLWIGNRTDTNTNAEQPIVEVEKKTTSLSDQISVSPTPIENKFDLALRKRIVKVENSNGTTLSILNEEGRDATRSLENIDVSTIPDTATYKHRKDPVVVSKGDVVTYRITIYNEGEINGYASKIVDQLPKGMQSVLEKDATITSHKGTTYTITNYDTTTNKLELTATESTAKTINKLSGTTLSSDYIEIKCKVKQTAASDGTTKHYLTNIAYIAEGYDTENNQTVTEDREGHESKTTVSPNENAEQLNTSDANSYKGNSENPSVYHDTNNTTYFEGEEDDDDFEKVVVMPKKFDLSLRKFISKVNNNTDFSAVTELNPSRAPQVDTSKLKAGTATTAIYNHTKEPIQLDVGTYVLYTIRAYNEGDLDAYASEITDYLPEYLDFVTGTEADRINSIWNYDGATRKATTKSTAANATTLLPAFDKANDDGNGSGLSYVDVQMICKINKNVEANKILTNIAEISEYKDEDGNEVSQDIDSEPANFPDDKKNNDYNGNGKEGNYVPGQQDDDDFEKVLVKETKVDIALTKFIAAVSSDTKIEDGEYLTPNKKIGSKTNEYIRATVADTTGLKAGTSTNATYTEKKDIEPLSVRRNSYILYDIRVYNEGEVDAYAAEVTDYLPENLEFVDCEFNKEYGWTADGQTVKTTYLSHVNGADKKLKAFDKEHDDGKGSGLDYKDLQILCKVSDKTESKKKLVNTAEITKYEDENGNDLPKDIDSTPNNKEEKNVEKRDEDDDDYEVVQVEEFDLSLLKYVTKTIVTENGKTTTTKTGNTGAKTDIIPKVEIYRKNVYKTLVKFEFTIKVTNEGDIEGYATELTDYVPKGLKFYAADNKGWKDEGNNVISTTLLKDTLLKPGQSATVKVILRWVNGENNLGLKTNVAEISKDKNEPGIPDRDSTPDNKKPGEDDIDDASVLLTISTGILENPVAIVTGALVLLVVLGTGLVIIKKYVL